MPIQGLSENRRYPRLGKIRLGIKKKSERSGAEYPVAVDYFVCPPEVQAVYGEKPIELDIMCPTEKLELFASQWWKCYSHSQGKICQGDGKTCRRKIDTDTGDFANRETKNYEWVEAGCDPLHCPMATGEKPQCKRVMSLIFVLPKVKGLGIYQLDTSSVYSILNINSYLADDGFLRHYTDGKVSNVPLKLTVVPQEVNPVGAGRKTVHVLSVRCDMALIDILKLAGKTVSQVLLPTLDDTEPPDDLFPAEILEEKEKTPALCEKNPSSEEQELFGNQEPKARDTTGFSAGSNKQPPAPAGPPSVLTPDQAAHVHIPKEEVEAIKTLGDLYTQCYKRWNLRPRAIWTILSVESADKIKNFPVAFMTVAMCKEKAKFADPKR